MTRQSAAALAVLCIASHAARAQDTHQVQQCANGVPALNASDNKGAHDALQHLLWHASFREYQELQSTRGARAAFDEIAARSETLLVRTRQGDTVTLGTAVSTLRQRLKDARALLLSNLRADSVALWGAIDTRPLKMSPDIEKAGRVLMGDVPIDIDSANRPIAAAICASAGTASRYLEYLMEPQLKKIALSYATAAHRWQLFVDEGYSMTLVERLAASCQLWVVGWIIDPLRDCSKSPGRSLEPPSDQIVFVHPSVGLTPLFRKDSTVAHLAIVEWYGFLHNRYSDKTISSFGVALASPYLEVGQSGLGGVVRTSWGTVGVFGRRANTPLYTVSADVLGWVPGVRKAADDLRMTVFKNAVETLAEKP